MLSVEDIKAIIIAKPDVFVVGCGASGQMKISGATQQVLRDNNIKLEVLNTYKAVRRLNELWQSGINVTAGLHLRC